MKERSTPRSKRETLLAELEGIKDVYRLDVRQFIQFVREKKLFIVEGYRQYAKWLDEEHDGKRYAPATINRKIAAARSRVRYAFKKSAYAASLQKKYRLEDILRAAKLKKIDMTAAPSGKVLDIESARNLVRQTKNPVIRLMVTFLVSTGVRVSEMLGIRLDELSATDGQLIQVRVKGKGGKARTVHVKKEFIDRIQTRFHGKTYLFEHQGRPYSRISVTNRIKQEALRVLGKEVTPQQLRHTWATIQIKMGRNVKAVAEVLGHTDPGLTARMYPKDRLKPEEAFLDLERMDDDGGRQPT